MLMRIPLPVFYLAENVRGQYVVVDGLQRLTTLNRFLNNKLRLKLPDRVELDRKTFQELSPKLQNRIEDCRLIIYIVDSRVPERARLDIFERVNGGVPLSRQQMRNCPFMGKATRFLKDESLSVEFLDATGRSLNTKNMRDREFINRYCAFRILGYNNYHGDMDDFLANALFEMNKMHESELESASIEFRTSMINNRYVFEKHAFRKSRPGYRRSVLNASLWAVMSTILSTLQRISCSKIIR